MYMYILVYIYTYTYTYIYIYMYMYILVGKSQRGQAAEGCRTHTRLARVTLGGVHFRSLKLPSATAAWHTRSRDQSRERMHW